MEAALRQKDQNQQNILGQTKDTMNSITTEIKYREDEISNLRYKIKQREMHCDAALISDTLNKHEVRNLQTKNESKDQQIEDLKKKL